MAKEQTIIALHGVLADGTIAKTRQAADVIAFVDDKRIFRIPVSVGKKRYVTTRKSSTELTASDTSHNLFTGVSATGIKIHFTHKKVVGKLIYWS